MDAESGPAGLDSALLSESVRDGRLEKTVHREYSDPEISHAKGM